MRWRYSTSGGPDIVEKLFVFPYEIVSADLKMVFIMMLAGESDEANTMHIKVPLFLIMTCQRKIRYNEGRLQQAVISSGIGLFTIAICRVQSYLPNVLAES